MIFGNSEKRRIERKAFGHFCLAFFSLTAFSFSSIPLDSSCGVTKEDDASKGVSLPNGDTALNKFEVALGDMKGLDGNLSLSASWKDSGFDSFSEIDLPDARLSYYSDEYSKAFHLDGEGDYNGEKLPFYLHYGNKEAYASFFGARYSYKASDFDSLFDSLLSIFGKGAFVIPDSFYKILDPIFSSDKEGSSFDGAFLSERISTSSMVFSWEFPFLMDGKIYFETDSLYAIKRIYGTDLTFGSTNLSFEYSVDDSSSLSDILSLAPADNSSFSPVVDSMGLVRKIVDITNEKKAGITFEGTFHNKTNVFAQGKPVEEDFDLRGNVYFDYPGKNFHGQAIVGGYDIDNTRGETSLDFLTKAPTLDSVEAFVCYNDLMKLSMDSSTFNELLGLFGDSSDAASVMEGALSFLSDSELMKEIRKGRYQDVVGMISKISTSSDRIEMNLDLSSLGLGEEASLSVALDANDGAVSKAVFRDCVLGNGLVNEMTITLVDFVDASFSEEGYFPLTELPKTGAQMLNLFQKKRANVSFNGSVLAKDGSGLGYPEISGNVFFDLNEGIKKGSGDVTLKHKVEDGGTKNNHVRVDVTGTKDTDVTRFIYNDGDSNNAGMRGQMSIRDINSVISMAVGLYNDEDPRFAKFFDPIRAALTSNAIGALTANRFGPFIASHVLTKAVLDSNRSVFTFDASAFGLSKGMTFDIALNFVSGEITSFEIIDMVIGEDVLNMKVELKGTAFDDSNLNIINDFTEGSYFQFDGVDKLLECALNESKRETFRLYSDSVKLQFNVAGALSMVTINLNLDFYIYVKGEVVKVYGVVSNVPNIIMSKDYNLFHVNTKRASYLYYDNIDTEKSSDGEEVALADQKGFLYVDGFYEHKRGRVDYEAKYSTNQLSDSKTVLHMLFYDILHLDLESFLDKMIGGEQTTTAYENLLDKYSYSLQNNMPHWEVGINLGALAGTNVLKNLEFSLNGFDESSSSKGYLSYLTIPTQKIMDKAGINIKVTESSINNAAPGPDYWQSGGASSWNSFVSSNRSKPCTSYNGLSS